MVRRLKSTVFLMCKESDTVTEVKKMLSGICRQEVEDSRLYQDQDGKGKDCSSHNTRSEAVFSML